MTFEWDDEKSQSNLEKHGVSFDLASEAFLDENAFFTQDDRFDYGEQREILIGRPQGLPSDVLLVVFTERQGETIRLISARKANRREKDWYYGQNG